MTERVSLFASCSVRPGSLHLSHAEGKGGRPAGQQASRQTNLAEQKLTFTFCCASDSGFSILNSHLCSR